MPNTISENEIKLLLMSDENQLLEQLGMRTSVVSRDLKLSAELNPQIQSKDVIAMGIKDDLSVLGRRVLRRWERTAYDICCGADPEDGKTRSDLRSALGLGEAAAIGVLTTALIGFGLMAALAPVIAAILVKRFFNSAYEEFCDFWKTKLSEKV